MGNLDIYNNDNFITDNRELIISVQENERQRIARDLHDASLQTLTHMVHQLELCDLYIDQDTTKAKFELMSIRKNLKTVIEEIRYIIFDLHPMSFEDLGLKQTYETFFDILKSYSSFEFDTTIDDIKNYSNYLLLSVYRIGRECVMNSIRHSKGTKIIFKCVKENDMVYLLIEDNGIGFSKEDVCTKKVHYGLNVIEERVKILNGSIHIESSKGTKINIRIPLS